MPKPETVQLFVTCLIDSFFPSVGESIVHMLNRIGVRVEFPSAQTCCGQPAFNAGLRSQSRPLAEHTIQVFEKTAGDIIIPSGSCAVMLRNGYLELFKEDPIWLRRAQTLAGRVHEFTEYLVDVRGLSDCGFGGVFSLEHPELSAEFLKRKIANLEKTASPTLVVCDTGCLMHIQGGLQRQRKTQRVVHIAQVLDSQ